MTASPSIREDLARLRTAIATACGSSAPALPFGVDPIDHRLAAGGLDRHGLHECAPASPTLNNCAAATLFFAGIAARFAERSRAVLWVISSFDLYAPGLEQAGLLPDRVLYAEARKDEDVLAVAEDGLRHGALAAIVAEVRKVGMTQTRRLQLAAAEGRTPMLLLRQWRRAGTCPLSDPSSAMTRWRIGSAPSAPLGHPGVGRGRWNVELVRQRGGNSFSLIVEACDDQGRIALPAAAFDRAVALDGAAARAA